MSLIKADIPFSCPCEKKAHLKRCDTGYTCIETDCHHSIEENAFRLIEGTPVLISDVNCDTACDPAMVKSYVARPFTKLEKIKQAVYGDGRITSFNARRFVELLKELSDAPKVLVIGSGELGRGTSDLWGNEKISIHGVDVYKTATVDVICDAHYLPLQDQSYDGVWIQAVLEHVIEPQIVASEIYRILKSGGLVYSETPFMQQVHEGAYDFTRFTVLGHRYLFKSFDLIDFGGKKGPETVLAWSLMYFFWGLLRSRRISQAIGLASHLFLRPFEPLMSKASLFDSCSGSFFLGRKRNIGHVKHKDLVKLYRGQF